VVAADARSTRLRVDVRDHGAIDVELHLVGAFNVANSLAAVAASVLVGRDLDTIARGLAAVRGVPGRLEPVADPRGVLVFVDYAHTPDALTRVLATVRPLAAAQPRGRVIVVFGCGGDRDARKRPEMGAAAVAGSDLAVLTTDNPRSEDPAAIADDVLAGIDAADAGDRVVVELDRRRAIRDALARARRGDVVVIAGKGHETGQTVRGVTTPFDDRTVAREAIEELSA
jgi:UDP-N-acetylmuramoyl-L-alanyl-D-glutamate--2,6-diaminopimelate ligase